MSTSIQLAQRKIQNFNINGKKLPVCEKLIEKIMGKGKTEKEARQMVYGDGMTPGIAEKNKWIDDEAKPTLYGVEKSLQTEKQREKIREFSDKNNIPLTSITYDHKGRKVVKRR